MRYVPSITLATLLLAGCESTPEPYPVYSQPYVVPPPAVPVPDTQAYIPLPAAPVFAAPADPQPVSPDIAEPLPAQQPDPPRDPVEDVLLKPILPPPDPQAQTPVPAAMPRVESSPAPDTGNAVPLMGFRPMRGQKQPGA